MNTYMITYARRGTWRIDQVLYHADTEQQARDQFWTEFSADKYVIDSIQADQ